MEFIVKMTVSIVSMIFIGIGFVKIVNYLVGLWIDLKLAGYYVAEKVVWVLFMFVIVGLIVTYFCILIGLMGRLV